MDTLAFAGAATIDSIALVARHPGPDERVVADQLIRAGGGPAATAAVTAARLGAAAEMIALLGADPEAEEILAGLNDEGVGTAAVRRVPGTRSATSMVTVQRDPATRSICNRPGPSFTPKHGTDAAVRALLPGASWLHVDHHGWPLVTAAAAAGLPLPPVSVDGGHAIESLDLSLVHLFAPTLATLRRLLGPGSPAELLATAQRQGPAIVVATDGPNGSWGIDQNGTVAHAPAAAGPILSTLGAGDVFHGALLVALGSPDGAHALHRSLSFANQVAARACGALDGRTAIPRSSDLDPAQCVTQRSE